MALGFGIAFLVVCTALFSLTSGFDRGLWIGALAGAVAFVATFAIVPLVARRQGIALGEGGPRGGAGITVPQPPADAFAPVLAAIDAQGAEITDSRPEDGVILARFGQSRRSWGEKLTVTLVPAADGATTVNLATRPAFPLQIVDWGKGKENIDGILYRLRRDLDAR